MTAGLTGAGAGIDAGDGDEGDGIDDDDADLVDGPWDDMVGVGAASVGTQAPSDAAGKENVDVVDEAIADVGSSCGGKSREPSRVLATQRNRVLTYIPGTGVRPFLFSRVFDDASTQLDVYEETGRRAVIDVLNGFNTCLLCYGQTGSGKTHTMFGPDGALEALWGGYEACTVAVVLLPHGLLQSCSPQRMVCLAIDRVLCSGACA